MPRDLVPRPDVLADLDAPARVLEHGAGGNLLLGDGHVIGGVEHDGDFGDRAGCHERLPGAFRSAAESTGRAGSLQRPSPDTQLSPSPELTACLSPSPLSTSAGIDSHPPSLPPLRGE